jgi:uncharacterized RDD family membrane protein YckC
MQSAQKATFGRRFAALMLDWIMCLGIAALFTPKAPGAAQFFPLLLLFAEVSLLTVLTGSSAGQRILRLRVVDDQTNGVVSPLRILARTLLICLVVPAIMTNNGRGYHEVLTHTNVIAL